MAAQQPKPARKIALRAAKIVLALPIIYLLSYFIVFFNYFPFMSSPDAINESYDPVGPTPNPWFCEGKIPLGAGSHDEQVFFTGEEWPFRMYRPFVNLYIQRRIRYLHSLDKDFEETEKLDAALEERDRKAKAKNEREHPQHGH